MKSCLYCIHFNITGNNYGECRRNAPTISNGITKFPMVIDTEWCGEFELRSELQRKQMKQLLMESGMKSDAEKYFRDI